VTLNVNDDDDDEDDDDDDDDDDDNVHTLLKEQYCTLLNNYVRCL